MVARSSAATRALLPAPCARASGSPDLEAVKVKTLRRDHRATHECRWPRHGDMGAPVFELEQVPLTSWGRPHARAGAAINGQTPGAWRWAPTPTHPSWPWPCCPWAIRTAAGGRCGHRACGAAGCASSTIRAFPKRVNAGFMQVLDRTRIRLRVHEMARARRHSLSGNRRLVAVGWQVSAGACLNPGWTTRGGIPPYRWAGGDAPVSRPTRHHRL
jgi:diaminopimelate epimerase